ncbi:solute carrier family 2, facilitated glucose transporter member 1-like [Eriocheir sinensis]|uniref:solute carrier family 2, facilitated glucose transporter member 1-like n=1 Tax=Eriocheir sinensis TaxID=95602 RepID=UPI0021C78B1F|nr:solute carrier family 2, facilitated glucose transporter member 1-like [Eriocheir sinensis]
MSEKTLMKQNSNSAKSFLASQSDSQRKGSVDSYSQVTPRLLLAVAVSILGSSLPGGYCLGVINTPQETIRRWLRGVVLNSYGLELTEKGEVSLWAVVVSIFVGGAIVGASVGGRVTDAVGRRTAMLLNHLLCIVSAFFLLFCKFVGSAELLVVGRFTSGLYTGLATCIVPLYLSEVAPFKLRGVMGVIFPMGMSVGVLIAQVLGLESILGTENGWPFLLGGFMVLPAVAVLAHPLLPESPTYCYIVAQDETRGLKELHRLRGSDNLLVEAEEAALKVLAHQMKDDQWRNNWSAMWLLRSSTYRLPLLLTMMANAAQQFSGINAVMYYSTLIFRDAGLDLHQSQLASIGAGAINGLMSVLALSLVRHCRRRVLLLTSMVLCAVCQAMLIVALWFLPTAPWASYCAIFALMAYITMYAIGLGPIPFMLPTELFPVGPRSVGIAVGGTTNWLSNMVVGLTFPLIQAAIGEFSFVLFIASSIVLGSVMYRYLPETFGKGILTESKDELSSESSKKTTLDLAIDNPSAV